MAPPPAAAQTLVRRDAFWSAVVGATALLVIASGVSAEPDFADEWAYISQSYFWADLAKPDDPHWLEYPAYDLPPLPKYAIGFALSQAGYRLPKSAAALAWYRNTSWKAHPEAMLAAARRPSVLMGTIGCMAIFALGALAVDRRVGLLAAGFLMLNPLYLQQARRAMSDVYAEALIVSCAAVGMLAWERILSGRSGAIRGILTFTVSGVLGGLAVLAKLNGGLGLMVLAAWCVLGLLVERRSWKPRGMLVAGTLTAGLAALVVFVMLNPFVTARPTGHLTPEARAIRRAGILDRCLGLIRHRLEVPRGQQAIFPHNALPGTTEKLKAVAVQGFGRFGLLGRKRYDAERDIWWFDSTQRYDWRQDAGALLWLPLVTAGAVWYAHRGHVQYREGRVPSCWAILLQATVALVTVTAFLPLAWDRFFLSIQPGSCLLASGPIVAAWDRLAGPRRPDGAA
jgi:4-amino-4-deoxy-L-arabinose transferase-like glycosyltransferase